MGEIVNLRPSRAKVYFELRDAGGALPCRAWRAEWEPMCARAGGEPVDGMQVCSRAAVTTTPAAHLLACFSFAVNDLRVAGEGDLLARIDRLRKQLDPEGLLEIQSELPRALLPRTIGVITGESGKARDDVLAALRGAAGPGGSCGPSRRSRTGMPHRRSCGRSATSPRSPSVDVIIVARGGGSLVDLLAFCDETLCRPSRCSAFPS